MRDLVVLVASHHLLIGPYILFATIDGTLSGDEHIGSSEDKPQDVNIVEA